MTDSFLLRFQEWCDDSLLGTVAVGTATGTKVRHEQPDADPTKADLRTLPLAQVHAGTVTITRIRNEQGDADYGSTARTLPVQPLMGTITKTAVKMEADDQDPRQHELTVLPKCSSY
jgi:hypothetical protein